MLDKIDHIGIAVQSLEAALGFYRDALGLPAEIEEVPEQQVRIAMLPVGESRIELLESTNGARASITSASPSPISSRRSPSCASKGPGSSTGSRGPAPAGTELPSCTRPAPTAC